MELPKSPAVPIVRYTSTARLQSQPMCKQVLPSFQGPESLLFTFEADDAFTFHLGRIGASFNEYRELQTKILGHLVPRTLFHVRLLRHVRLAAARIRHSGTIASEILANELAMEGYTVSLQRGEGGGPGTQCFKNLRHTFLTVQDPDSQDSFIVELSFRDHFAIPLQSLRYQSLLDLLPDALVALPSDLSPLVDIVSRELTRAFAAAGLDIPPWRQAKSMLSKWLPKRAQSTSLSAAPNSELAAAGSLHCHPRVVTHEPALGSEPASPTSPWSDRASDAGDAPGGASPRAVLPEDEEPAGKLGALRGEGGKRRSLLSWSLALQPAPGPQRPGAWQQEPTIRVVQRQGSRHAVAA
ncbi:hypothetical protein F751_2226 [Auxenochlorella protothecoides]|uniref:Uncharacterized protein n=1 Tax=Auxenochlorella protothecoides TaxID=3075 RepID=A0A087SLN5_AUXPR|nr:hypothetical protein F751_2226 [Auxenochlorella protothecoides]KFM26639.1 hypothetical protein F751_2226 [Auxenochlorella protothecoides]